MDELFNIIMVAVQAMRDKGYTVQPGRWGVRWNDQLKAWEVRPPLSRVFPAYICPLACVLLKVQPGTNSVSPAAGIALGITRTQVNAIVQGVDNGTEALVDTTFLDPEYIKLGQRIRHALGFAPYPA